MAWIVEKFKEWTNSGHELPEQAIDRDRILTDVMIYWLTGTAGSSANLYYDGMHAEEWPTPTQVPTGVATFAEDVAIRRYAERGNNIVHWSDFDEGGHFAALETPARTSSSSSLSCGRQPARRRSLCCGVMRRC